MSAPRTTSSSDAEGPAEATSTPDLARLAHDLRGPAGVLRGVLEELELALGPQAADHARLFAVARRGVERILAVAERLQEGVVAPREPAPSPRRPRTYTPWDADGPVTILVVDDDEDSAALVAMVLAREGWAVETVGTLGGARLALARLQPRVVLCDRQLPDGDGFSLLQPSRPPFLRAAVLLTGEEHSGRFTPYGGRSFDATITKPAEPRLLVETLRRLLAPSPRD